MMSQLVCAVFTLSLVSGAVIKEKPEILQWYRDMGDGKISEHAELYKDLKQIVMISQSDKLPHFGYQKSNSWHDFQTNELAIKFTEGKKQICFLTKTKKSFDETLRDLTERKGQTIPALGERRLAVKSLESVKPRSENLIYFCEGADMYNVEETQLRSGEVTLNPTPLAPYLVRTMCFYGPVDFDIPYDFIRIIIEIIIPMFPIF